MSSPLLNDRFLRALRREPVDTTPIWVMRQAGRYLPEYRKLRAEAGSFMKMATTPELACEVTLQPLRRFDLDAAILFSDILTIPDAMGLELSLVPGKGPVFAKPVQDEAAIKRLGIPDMETDLRYVTDAVRLIRRELGGKVPLIGFAGSPWTLACYMVEGHGSRDFATLKGMCFARPDLAHHLLDLLARSVALYLAAQAAAGAQALMIFDSWGGLLSAGMYPTFSLAYMEKIVQHLQQDEHAKDLPVILFSKGAGTHLEQQAATGCAALGLDWTVDIADARQRVGDRVALQGNLDPSALYADIPSIEREATAIVEAFGPHPGHVFNLGHGITPGVKPEHMAALVDAVHAAGKRVHQQA